MGRQVRDNGITVSSSGGVETKTVTVTVTAGNFTGSVAHGLGFTPKVSRPNPDSVYGSSAYSSADGTNVTVTLSDAQPVDVIFTVHLSAV